MSVLVFLRKLTEADFWPRNVVKRDICSNSLSVYLSVRLSLRHICESRLNGFKISKNSKYSMHHTIERCFCLCGSDFSERWGVLLAFSTGKNDICNYQTRSTAITRHSAPQTLFCVFRAQGTCLVAANVVLFLLNEI